MKTKEQMMKVAQDFISLHKEAIRLDWVGSLLETYHRLEAGCYGEVREEDGWFTIEIERTESNSGIPVLFEWRM